MLLKPFLASIATIMGSNGQQIRQGDIGYLNEEHGHHYLTLGYAEAITEDPNWPDIEWEPEESEVDADADGGTFTGLTVPTVGEADRVPDTGGEFEGGIGTYARAPGDTGDDEQETPTEDEENPELPLGDNRQVEGTGDGADTGTASSTPSAAEAARQRRGRSAGADTQ